MITYSIAVKNARLQLVVNAIDAGAGVGVLVLGTAALSGATGLLVAIPLAKPSFVVAAAAMTMLGVPLAALSTGAGVAALAELRDSAGNVIVSGLTVGVAGTDIILAAPSISIGQLLQDISSTITHA
jgi:hypothetical protein